MCVHVYVYVCVCVCLCVCVLFNPYKVNTVTPFHRQEILGAEEEGRVGEDSVWSQTQDHRPQTPPSFILHVSFLTSL